MPVGVTTAITAGAAILGAGATLIASDKASGAQTAAAQTAADTSLAVAGQNNALARETYAKNEGHLSPYIDRGNTAGDALMSMLLGPAPTTSGGSAAGTGSGTAAPAPSSGSAPTPTATPLPTGGTPLGNAVARAATRMPAWKADIVFGDGPATTSALGGGPAATPGTGTGTTPAPAPGTTPAPAAGGTAPSSALSGWDAFQKSASYTTPLNAGLAAIGSQYAANGAFESGAEKKALDRFASDYASNALAGWMDQLYRQESLGVTAASSLAGVGTSMVNQVSANNNNAADAASNAALVAGQARANNWTNVGSALSGAAGTIGGALSSSYGKPAADPSWLDTYTVPTGIDAVYGYTG